MPVHVRAAEVCTHDSQSTMYDSRNLADTIMQVYDFRSRGVKRRTFADRMRHEIEDYLSLSGRYRDDGDSDDEDDEEGGNDKGSYRHYRMYPLLSTAINELVEQARRVDGIGSEGRSNPSAPSVQAGGGGSRDGGGGRDGSGGRDGGGAQDGGMVTSATHAPSGQSRGARRDARHLLEAKARVAQLEAKSAAAPPRREPLTERSTLSARAQRIQEDLRLTWGLPQIVAEANRQMALEPPPGTPLTEQIDALCTALGLFFHEPPSSSDVYAQPAAERTRSKHPQPQRDVFVEVCDSTACGSGIARAVAAPPPIDDRPAVGPGKPGVTFGAHFKLAAGRGRAEKKGGGATSEIESVSTTATEQRERANTAMSEQL